MRFLLVVALAAVALVAACGGRAPDAGPTPGADAPWGEPPVGLDVVERLRFPRLDFDPPEPERFELSNGVSVFFLRDATLPLVDFFIDIKGGYIYFDRDRYGAGAAFASLIRHGGTTSLPPDSVDELIEFHALGMGTSSDGGRITLGVSALRRQLDLALGLWADMLLRPGFDADAVERWRLRELESVRRTADFPGSLAVLEFNRLMYGDHPTGWRLTPEDLEPERVTPDRLHTLHRAIACPESAVIGVAGAVTKAEIQAALEHALAGWRPCGTKLTPPPPPRLRADPRVYVIPKALTQSTIVVGQPGGILMRDDDEYFASRLASWVLGGGGFASRLTRRLRTEEGLAYSASSIWGAAREHERILGAITHTKSESTVPATRMIIETMADVVRNPPTSAEIELARSSILNGFVFGFSNPIQIVARKVTYTADGLPGDWLERYLRGIRRVDRTDVARVLARHVDPSSFTILIVGDTAAFDAAELGPVTLLPAR